MFAICFQKYPGNSIVRSFEEPPKELGLSKQLKAERQLKLEILHDAARRTSRKKLRSGMLLLDELFYARK